MAPLISVVMSVYNGQKYISEAIKSILDQSFSDFELIIIDDASTDCSLDIIRGYARVDNRIHILRNHENHGLTKSLNLGIRFAKGQYIARLDADDISSPKRLEMQLNAFNINQALELVACAFYYITEGGEIMYQGPVFRNDLYRLWRLQFNNIFIHSTVMFKKNSETFYDENFLTAQDYDLWSRIVKKNNFAMVDIPLVYHRISNTQISNLYLLEQNQMAQEISNRNLELCNSGLDRKTLKFLRQFYAVRQISLCELKNLLPPLTRLFWGFRIKYGLTIKEIVITCFFIAEDILLWLKHTYWLRRDNTHAI